MLLLLNGTLLLLSAVFISDFLIPTLVLLMLISPYLDKNFTIPAVNNRYKNTNFSLITISVTISVTGYIANIVSFELIIYNLLIAALPEEWFFRVYFQTRLLKIIAPHLNARKTNLSAILLTSILFSSVHAIAQKDIHLLYIMIIPSVFFGFIYLKTKDFIVIVNLHFISNMILYLLLALPVMINN